MSLIWEDKYKDRKELEILNGIDLRSLYHSSGTPQNMKKLIAEVAASKLIRLEDEVPTQTVHDIFAEVKVVNEHNAACKDEKVTLEAKTYENILRYGLGVQKDINDAYKDNKEIPLSAGIILKSALQMINISLQNLGDEYSKKIDPAELEEHNKVINDGIVEGMKVPEKHSSDDAIRQYTLAKDAGALDDVDIPADVEKQFLAYIAKVTGWQNTDKDSIKANDKTLYNYFGNSVDVYIKDKNSDQYKLNPLFDGCQELAQSISYDFSPNTAKEVANKYTTSLNQQLMANALQRATQDVLKNKKWFNNIKTKDEAEAKFKRLIAQHFERSIFIAGLASSDEVAKVLKIDAESGRVEFDEKNELVRKTIESIQNKQLKIHPKAVALDSHQLRIETSCSEKVLKNLKKVDVNELPFYQKVSSKAINVAKAFWNKLAKQGGWKKFVANFGVYGGAIALMSNPATAAIVTGAVVYAGWTAVNAWVAPVYDKVISDMYEVKGLRKEKVTFKDRWDYIKKNWAHVKEEKHKEPGFKKRAAWRTVEGSVIGLACGGLSFGGAPVLKTFVRQGLTALGKTASLVTSLFKRKSATKKLNQVYSVKNYNALHTAEEYVKQDATALAAVTTMSAGIDTFQILSGKIDLSDINQEISEITSKLKGNVEVVDAETVIEQQENQGQQEQQGQQENQEQQEVVVANNDHLETQGETAVVSHNGETVEIKLVKTEELTLLDENSKLKFNSDDAKEIIAGNRQELEKLAAANNTDAGDYVAKGTITDQSRIGNGTVEEFYEAIKNGDVTTIPQGMSAQEYVNRLSRLMELAPGVHKKAIDVMIKDLLCDEFQPTDADKLLVAKAMNDIIYEKGEFPCLLKDKDGNLCYGTTYKWGQYVGPQKTDIYQHEDGTTERLPIRTTNRTIGHGFDPNCGGDPKIANLYEKGPQPDCGCDDVEVESNPAPKPEPAPKPAPKPEPKPEPEDLTAGGNDIEAEGSKNVATPKKQISVNMRDPYAVSSSVQSGEELPISTKFIGGKAMAYRTKGFETIGVLRVWNKEGVVFLGNETGDENNLIQTEDIDTGINGRDYTFHMANKLEDVIAKLPDAPTKVIEAEDGSITYTYEFGKGDNFRVVIDAPKESEEVRIGHFYIGKKEVIIDEKAADALMTKMSNNPSMQFTSVDGDEQSGDVIERIEINKAITRKMQDYKEDLINKMENPVSPSENAEHIVPKITTENVEIAATQRAEIMKETTELQFVKFEDEKAVLSVKGANGFNNIRVPKPVHVDYDLAKHQPVATVGENNNYTVEITTANEQKVLVTIADGKASTTLNGKPVVLDTDSSSRTENLVELALKKQNVNMNLTLHNEYTKKIISAIERGSNNQQITALHRATPNTVPLASHRASAR